MAGSFSIPGVKRLLQQSANRNITRVHTRRSCPLRQESLSASGDRHLLAMSTSTARCAVPLSEAHACLSDLMACQIFSCVRNCRREPVLINRLLDQRTGDRGWGRRSSATWDDGERQKKSRSKCFQLGFLAPPAGHLIIKSRRDQGALKAGVLARIEGPSEAPSNQRASDLLTARIASCACAKRSAQIV
jgi:hypothetical protein